MNTALISTTESSTTMKNIFEAYQNKMNTFLKQINTISYNKGLHIIFKRIFTTLISLTNKCCTLYKITKFLQTPLVSVNDKSSQIRRSYRGKTLLTKNFQVFRKFALANLLVCIASDQVVPTIPASLFFAPTANL